MELFQFYRFQKYKKFLQKNCFLIFWHTEWRPVYVQRCCRRQHSMSASFFTDFIKWSNAWNSVLQLIFFFCVDSRNGHLQEIFMCVRSLWISTKYTTNVSRVHTKTRTMSFPYRVPLYIDNRLKLIARKTIEFFKDIINFWLHKFVFRTCVIINMNDNN